MNSLGKSENATSALQENRAAKVSGLHPIEQAVLLSLITMSSQLVFASRILFVVNLGATKLSTIFLIREIFTRDATKWLNGGFKQLS